MTFEYKGKTYTVNPDLDILLEEIGIRGNHLKSYVAKLNKGGYYKFTDLININREELIDLGFTPKISKRLQQQIQIIKQKGGMLHDLHRDKEIEYLYLPTGSTMLDEMLTYTDGNVGLRSKTLTELYGESSTGKTQFCMTLAAICMKPQDKGGLGRGVLYIDTDGAFNVTRFEYLTRYWGVSRDFLKNNLFYSKATSFEEMEIILQEATSIEEIPIGVIVLDSLFPPTQKTIRDLSGLQKQQQQLRKILTGLKGLARTKNAIVVYSNQVIGKISEYASSTLIRKGGPTVSHASDVCIHMLRASKSESNWMGSMKTREKRIKLEIHPGKAIITDSAFLPNNEGYFLITPMGIADPRRIEEIEQKCLLIKQKGYLCIDARGYPIEPIYDKVSRAERLQKTTRDLYGKEVDLEEFGGKTKESNKEPLKEDEEMKPKKSKKSWRDYLGRQK